MCVCGGGGVDAGKAEQNGLILEFIYDSCWWGKKVVEKTNRDFIGKNGV